MRRGSQWSIADRMAAGFLLVLATLAALVLLIGWRLAENDQAGLAMEAGVARAQRIDELERSVLLFATDARDALLDSSPAQLNNFAASEARLHEAVRGLERLQADAPTAAGPARALAPLVAQYASAVRSAVTEGRSETSDLVVLRTAVLDRVQQMLREHDAVVGAAMARMQDNRQAAGRTLVAGTLISGLLLVLIALVTVRAVRRPARELVGVASALSSGNWQPALALRAGNGPQPETRFEMAQIAQAFGAAAAALELREQRLVAHGEIARAAGASLDPSEIAEAALRVVLQHVGAEVGALYCRDAESGHWVPLSTRSLAAPLAPVPSGEGIVGQSARDRQPVVVRDIPRDTPFLVHLGCDAVPPRTVAAVPILFNGEAVGVLLVASLRELDAATLAFLGSAATQIGVGLMNASAYQDVQDLLARVRAQGEEIQAQNEELQAQTEELQAQSEEIHAQNEELQAQGEEIQAQNEDLHRQAGSLREADERKNEFLGVLAHELRNPLTPIANCVELLRRKPGEAHALRHAHEMLGRQVRHMTRLIDDLLDVTRISRGKVNLQRERLNLIELVHQCVDDQRPALEQQGLVLSLALPEVPIHIEGDHTRLCQVFSNLVVNVLKFCDRGTRVAVTVTLDAPAREVAVHVADSGIGIEPDFLARIFEPFSQAESELARTKGGLGLGLALAKALVELHGGRITARSEGKGQGAEFVVTLPLAEAHEHPDAAGAQAGAVPRAAHAAAARRVLVIDDNQDAADSLAQLLALEGCQVEVAYTAQAGLMSALRLSPQAVVCDIGLPGMDGYAFAREVRRHEALRSILLVALTGYSAPADQRRAAEAGFDMHMAKPPDVPRLLRSLAGGDADRAVAGAGAVDDLVD